MPDPRATPPPDSAEQPPEPSSDTEQRSVALADAFPDARPHKPAATGSPGAGGTHSRESRGGEPAGVANAGSRSTPVRRGPADPVKTLMHRHRELCERAVDPLEIAAGLEAHGVTDRTAARFRHRDVFSLAEELYARVPRGDAGPQPVAGEPPRAVVGRTAPALLPGAVAVISVVALRLTDGGARLVTGAVCMSGLAVAVVWGLRHGPLRVAGRTVPATRLLVCWLAAYTLFGDALTDRLAGAGPAAPVSPAGSPLLLTPGPLVGLALAVAPAAWSARLFSGQARRRLGDSRGLKEFAAGTRPLLLATVALYAGALTGLLVLVSLLLPVALVPVVALGLLLYLARLLTVHGFAESAATGLAVACAGEALALACLLGGRLVPGSGLARPVEAVVDACGTGAVPALACGTAAVGLLVHATAVLSRASAHTT
ncbi:hypothetical protein [Streptomyces sp. NPDC059176]|uniref:hypothetical protein n=1 Tax=Streptomyces sp. NPDC059176 TaxID=3346758 RepID=UPI00368270FD